LKSPPYNKNKITSKYNMSSGTDASNLGYGGQSPFVGNPSLVNPDNSHYPGGFGSNEAPMFGKFGLPGAAYNVDAANSFIPGLSLKGGAKKLKRKIKNITKIYKGMKKTMRKRIGSMKRKIMTRFHKKGGKSRRSRRSSARRMKMRGGMPDYPAGYSQYQNNLPMSNSYSLANVKLSPNESALANPAPYQRLSNCVNCVDNYNANTNEGFPSRGWW
jgi:hypothetical protein